MGGLTGTGPGREDSSAVSPSLCFKGTVLAVLLWLGDSGMLSVNEIVLNVIIF